MNDILNKKTRTRFAPSPSGYLHIGNLRAALFSYICAKENNGDFILRIEDTDKTRTSDEYLNEIYKILNWVQIIPDEGPEQGGIYGSYFQSERSEIYTIYLNKLIEKGYAYRCFKTVEELDEIKKKQLLQKLPPRYEREKCIISNEDEKKFLNEKKPFIWRFKIPNGKTFIFDKVRGKIEYDLFNFSDSPLTRQDGTFTFLFSNFIDDVEMKITNVIRGEEHSSNTAIQSALYDILEFEKPEFYHLPLICDLNGKKLSKRDFGFSIRDLKNENYLPEAIINYLIIIGNSIKDEIFSTEEAIKNKVFSKINNIGSAICYDLKKLQWVNKQWISKISLIDFKNRIKNEVFEKYKDEGLFILENENLLTGIKNESSNLNDSIEMIKYFLPSNKLIFNSNDQLELEIKKIIEIWLDSKDQIYNNFLEKINLYLKNNLNIQKKDLFKKIRKIFTEKEEGISISLLINEFSVDLIKNKLL